MFSSPTRLFFDAFNFFAAGEVKVAPLTIGIAVRAELASGGCMGAMEGLSFSISTGAGDAGGRDRRMRVGDNGKSNIGCAGGLGGGLSRSIEPRVVGNKVLESGFEVGATGATGATVTTAVVVVDFKGSGALR